MTWNLLWVEGWLDKYFRLHFTKKFRVRRHCNLGTHIFATWYQIHMVIFKLQYKQVIVKTLYIFLNFSQNRFHQKLGLRV